MLTNLTECRLAQFRLLVLSLCVLSVLCVKTSSQDYKQAHDGVEYAELTREISGKQVKMNLLRLDLKKVRLDVHHAMDMAIGTERTSSIATRHGAFAAINAGFYRLDNSIWAGDETGALIIDGKFLSEPDKNRTSLYILNSPSETNTLIQVPNWDSRLNFGDKLEEIISLAFRLNCERSSDDIVVYTPEFGRRTLTTANGLEIVVRNDRIESISDQKGNTEIPSDGYIVSASGQQREKLLAMSKLVRKKKRVGQLFTLESAQAPYLDDVVSGVPQLIKNSKIDITWEQEKASKSFVETRHPRTAVAKLKDGKFLMVTVDGRSEESAGIDLYDLAKLLLEFGATDAMNLDGGGSTTMFLDGKVVNKPSDPTGERKVGDAILVTLRRSKR